MQDIINPFSNDYNQYYHKLCPFVPDYEIFPITKTTHFCYTGSVLEAVFDATE